MQTLAMWILVMQGLVVHALVMQGLLVHVLVMKSFFMQNRDINILVSQFLFLNFKSY